MLRVRMSTTIAVLILLVASAAHAQWLNLPTPGVPRLPDGKVNLTAPAPKTADGRPDFSASPTSTHTTLREKFCNPRV
jgi:hypothetical protein